MSIKLPYNKIGGRANPVNEAHMLAVSFKGLQCMMVEYSAQNNTQNKANIMARGKVLRKAQADALDLASIGDFVWRTAIEVGGKTILDYWDGSSVIYPSMLNHSNISSKLSFLYYLGHSLPEIYPALSMELKKAHEALIVDDFWIINTLADVVG